MPDEFQRDLMRGSLDLMVLAVLADGALYGYLIQKKVRESSGETVKLNAGTLYPLLHRLEAAGAIRAKWDRSTGRDRKWYELTAAGRRRLESHAQQWHDYARCIRQFLQPAITAMTARPSPG